MALHSTLGPSSAKRWIACPGSVALSAAVPKEPPSEYAAEGTVAHSLAEELVTGRVDSLDLMDRIGTTVAQDGFDIEITEEMVDAAVEYADLIKNDWKAMEAVKRPSAVRGKAEVRVCASSVDPNLWGTSDYVLYRPGHKLIVYDFKYGKGVAVEAAANEQMAIYALGVMDGDAGWAFEEVELVIHQPRAGHAEGPVRRWATSVTWLKDFRDNLIDAVKDTQSPTARLSAGDWCRWCPAKASCPELLDGVQKQAQVDFAVTPVPAPKTTTGLPSVALMPVHTLASALLWEDAINSWYEALKERAREMLSSGQDVPGFKLVEGRSNRKWVSEEAVIRKFAPILGEEKLFEKKLLSPAKMEKILGKGRLEEEGLTFKPDAPKAIARDTDPRPVAKSSAEDDFRPAKAVVDELEMELMGAAPAKTVWPQ